MRNCALLVWPWLDAFKQGFWVGRVIGRPVRERLREFVSRADARLGASGFAGSSRGSAGLLRIPAWRWYLRSRAKASSISLDISTDRLIPTSRLKLRRGVDRVWSRAATFAWRKPAALWRPRMARVCSRSVPMIETKTEASRRSSVTSARRTVIPVTRGSETSKRIDDETTSRIASATLRLRWDGMVGSPSIRAGLAGQSSVIETVHRTSTNFHARVAGDRVGHAVEDLAGLLDGWPRSPRRPRVLNPSRGSPPRPPRPRR